MLKIKMRKQFKRDFKKINLDKSKNISLFKETILTLSKEEELPPSRKDHALIGNYKGCRECHLAYDWLLIYIIDNKENFITLVRTGTHSELF